MAPKREDLWIPESEIKNSRIYGNTISNVGPAINDNRPATPVVKPDYVPGASEQKVIDANARAKAAPYTSDPAIISARGDDQALSAYDKRTGGTPAYNGAPTYEKAALDTSIGNTDGRMLDILKGMDKDRGLVSTAGTETVLLNNLGQPRGTGTASAGPVTGPATVNTIPTVVAPAPVIPTVQAQAVKPTTPVIAPTENSIMRDTFNALKDRNLNVAGPGNKGNTANQKIWDEEYARRAAEVGLAPRMTRSKLTNTGTQVKVDPQKGESPTIIPKQKKTIVDGKKVNIPVMVGGGGGGVGQQQTPALATNPVITAPPANTPVYNKNDPSTWVGIGGKVLESAAVEAPHWALDPISYTGGAGLVTGLVKGAVTKAAKKAIYNVAEQAAKRQSIDVAKAFPYAKGANLLQNEVATPVAKFGERALIKALNAKDAITGAARKVADKLPGELKDLNAVRSWVTNKLNTGANVVGNRVATAQASRPIASTLAPALTGPRSGGNQKDAIIKQKSDELQQIVQAGGDPTEIAQRQAELKALMSIS